MKLPANVGLYAQKIFKLGLILGIAAAGLSGCYGNNARLIPGDWNVVGAPGAMHSANSAPLAQSGVAQQPLANPGNLQQPEAPAFLPNFSGPFVSAGLIGGLQRQADCSLTYFDFSYTSNSPTPIGTPHSQIPHYEETLHDNSFLGTTPDQFPVGCVDPSKGITSRPFLFLGIGKSGRELVAVPGTYGVVTSGLESNGKFTQPATQVTPTPPITLVSGDLNKDGNADVVSINSNGVYSSVTVFLGRDDGSYQPGVNYTLPGANAKYAVLDDLNGDGILDLLVSSDSPAFAFSIFIGNGDGTFQPPQNFTPATAGLQYDQSFVTADVNGDGIKDIVTAQGQVFLGTGNGVTYAPASRPAFPPVNTATNEFAPSIVAADFNHDGKMDLATNDGLTVRTYLGNGDGTFTAGPEYPTIANYGFLIATDLDGDGNIDLWTGYGGNGVYSGDGILPDQAYALMGNGDGTFQGTPGLPAVRSVAATTTAVTQPLSSSKNDTSVIFHSEVSSIAEGAITGTVTFFDGSNQIGSPVTIGGGSAEISVSTLKPGVHSITAKYSGDSNYAASTSPAVAHTASNNSASLTITSPSPGSLSVVSGQTSAPFTVIVTSLITTAQTVTFTCSGLPAQAACNFPSTPVTLAANGSSQQVPITIGPITTTFVTPSRRLLSPSDSTNSRWLSVFVLLALSSILLRARPRRAGWVLSACLLLVALTSLNSCSNSSSTPNNGIPPGVYTVTVSALGSGTPVTAANGLKLTITAP